MHLICIYLVAQLSPIALLPQGPGDQPQSA